METTHDWVPRQVGVAPRAIAAVLDALVSGFLLGIPLTIALEEKTTAPDGTSVWEMHSTTFVIWVVLTLFYFILFETLFGATIGKLVLALRVRYSDGSPIGLGAAFWRNLLRLVDCFPYFLPYLLGALFIWGGNERQRLGDMVAGTIVTWR
jgi:uncharacterized RDD family membrane protein YckC